VSDDLRHVHFIAIGGTGMGSLAGLVKARGIEVTGSDKALYPPMSTALEGWGIPVEEGFSPAHVLDRRPDLVVIGNAVRRDNPEAQAAIDAGLPYRSFSDALYELAMAHRHSVTVTGTHGKTTTTALTSYLLLATGRDPSLLVGGISLDFGGSFREGDGEHFVVEGDEYDTAFFDKTPKFLHYHPQTLIVTSVEFDHADIYRDLDHVKSMFRQLVTAMPADGTIVAAWDHEGVRDVVADAPCRVVRYGLEHPDAAWRAGGIETGDAGTRFALTSPGADDVNVTLPMHGRFNVENALAAIATCVSLGVPLSEVVDALPGFRGVKRRQEVRGEIAGVTVLDDFAHHPTAVRGTIEAVLARYPGRRVIAVFEPRSNTSRRKLFQAQYADALAAAHRVIAFEVPVEPIYSATGEVTELFSAPELVEDLRARQVDAACYGDVDAIVERILSERRVGDVVLVMSNGGFGGIFEKLLGGLAAAADEVPPEGR
jgi:UDP-N-acetylmuramate: L-alanyl-gamma-D-glutamyl-meso-diaminopimelate ligase